MRPIITATLGIVLLGIGGCESKKAKEGEATPGAAVEEAAQNTGQALDGVAKTIDKNAQEVVRELKEDAGSENDKD